MVSIHRNVVGVAKHNASSKKKHLSWFPDVDEVDGRQYVLLNLGDPRFKAFIDHKPAMHDLIMKRRNDAIDAALKGKFDTAAWGYIGYEPQGGALRLPKRKREEMTDQLPNVLIAVVKTTEGHEYDVRCLMVSAARHQLSIELTNENMELLQADPDTVPEDAPEAPYRPSITVENVKWNVTRKMVYCTYFDVEKKHLRKKSFRVLQNEDRVAFQRNVDTAAQEAANFYALNHHKTRAISNGTPAISNGASDEVDGALLPV